jgi:hypothetical protein
MKLQTLQNTNQPVHVQIPEINFCERISFGHFRTIFLLRSAALRVSTFKDRFRRMFRVLVGHTNSGAAQGSAARDKYPPCFQLRRGFCDRFRGGKTERNWGLRKLRPEREMDNFLSSHRCTSDVRFWSGARSVLVAPTRPATSLCFSSVLAPSTLALAKVMFLVFPNLGDVLCSPAPMFSAVHSELFGGRNLSSSLPSE